MSVRAEMTRSGTLTLSLPQRGRGAGTLTLSLPRRGRGAGTLTPTLPRRGRGIGAFTLIEVLVVISVIMILIGILVGSAVAVWRKAQKVQVAHELTKLHDAIDLYHQAAAEYPPPTVAYLNSKGVIVPGCAASFYEYLYFSGAESRWFGTQRAGQSYKAFWIPEKAARLNAQHEYLDPWGNPYVYFVELETYHKPDGATGTRPRRFVVFSRGRNGINETEDDDPSSSGDDISSAD